MAFLKWHKSEAKGNFKKIYVLETSWKLKKKFFGDLD